MSSIITYSIICNAQTISDVEGNVYGIVTIGTQTWMKENLKTSKFNDGSDIPLVTDSASWSTLTTPAYCWYDNDHVNKNIYGALYNWYTVNTCKLCPTGWHVPSDSEWNILTDFLGGYYIAGGKLKETGTLHWSSPNTGATNEVNFTALPGGHRIGDGTFSSISYYGRWWSSTEAEITPETALSQTIGYKMEYILELPYNNPWGFSVRCLMDSISINIRNKFLYRNINKNISIYPNPTIDYIFIDNYKKQILKLTIYNFLGELVLQRQLINEKNRINISNLAKGLYIINVSIASATMQHKLIIK